VSKTLISIRNLLTEDSSKVKDIVAELEASRLAPEGQSLWTERLLASSKGGKMNG
jgi:hypothetical protein